MKESATIDDDNDENGDEFIDDDADDDTTEIKKLVKTRPGTVHLIVHTSFEMIFKLIKLYVKPVTT